MAEAGRYFVDGFTAAFKDIASASDARVPMLVIYGHRQEESTAQGLTSTAWDSLLGAMFAADLRVVGTWPIHGPHSSRQRSQASNALASYIVLVCRPRSTNAPVASRQQFVTALKAELPPALRALQDGNVAPVDLAQAAIGPGIGVFSRYAKVVEADGSTMSVRMALGLINQVRDEIVAEQDGTSLRTAGGPLRGLKISRNDGPYGVAETLSKAKNTAVNGLVEAGVVYARAGRSVS